MADTLATIVSLLTDNWTSDNTDSITPQVDEIFDLKRVGGMGGYKTVIGVYQPAGNTRKVNTLGYQKAERTERITIDIRTSESRSHLINCRDEAESIIKSNRLNTSGFDVVYIPSSQDLSDKTRKLWRWIIELEGFVGCEDMTS